MRKVDRTLLPVDIARVAAFVTLHAIFPRIFAFFKDWHANLDVEREKLCLPGPELLLLQRILFSRFSFVRDIYIWGLLKGQMRLCKQGF